MHRQKIPDNVLFPTQRAAAICEPSTFDRRDQSPDRLGGSPQSLFMQIKHGSVIEEALVAGQVVAGPRIFEMPSGFGKDFLSTVGFSVQPCGSLRGTVMMRCPDADNAAGTSKC